MANGSAAKTSVDLMHDISVKVQSTVTQMPGCGALHLYFKS